MSSNKKHLEKESGESSEEEQGSEESIEKGKEQTSLRGFARKLNAQLAVIIAATLVVGILVGQVAMPNLGVGLISMPAGIEAGTEAGIDTEAFKPELETWLNNMVLGPQGVSGKVLSIEPYDNDFYEVGVEISRDGQALGEESLFLTKSGSAISGSILFLDEEIVPAPQPQPQPQPEPTDLPNIGTFESFNNSGYEVELEEGKPVVRLFSTTWCPHCQWVRETFDNVVKEYVDAGKIAAYHWEVDTGDNTLTAEVEAEVPASELAVYQEFNPKGSIPTFVFGGKYYRVGNGFEAADDLAAEEAAFRAVIDKILEEAGQ